MMSPTLGRDFPWLISVSVDVTWKKIPMVLVETGSNNLGFSEMLLLSKKHLSLEIQRALSFTELQCFFAFGAANALYQK